MFVYGLLLLFSLAKQNFCVDSGLDFEGDVDAIIKDELGHQPFKKRLNIEDVEMPPLEINTSNAKQQNNTNTTKEKKLNTSEVLDILYMRKLNILIKRKTNRLEQFKNNVDVFKELYYSARIKEPRINGRRISEVNNEFLESMLYDAKSAVLDMTTNSALRYKQTTIVNFNERPYPYSFLKMERFYPAEGVHRMRQKVLAMMYTHTYRTQFYLTYATIQRNKYIDNVRYKLGFCFALLKQIEKEGRLLVNGVYFFLKKFLRTPGLMHSWALYVVEKLTRIEKDARDLIKHIKGLEYERKMLEEPDYYETFSSSTGRYSG